MILSAIQGTNADQFPQALELHVPAGAVVADVTYGHGTFWKNVPQSRYKVLATDLAEDGVSLDCLPYEAASLDALVLDPPYMSDANPGDEDLLSTHYRNNNTSHEGVVRMYAGGMLEAARCLKPAGKILVKCQDEWYYRRQRLTHVELSQLLELLGFRILDLFVLVRHSPPRKRNAVQRTARKNHSYLLVAELLR